jgi:ATP-dependent helicase/nuclease subunit A
MPEPITNLPPDHAERSRALDPKRSFLVQAPAGSGKTHLLTQRFLRLLAEAEQPDEIVAITFTNAAAAEMRNRILSELERAEEAPAIDDSDPESLEALARRALDHSRRMGWKILDQPSLLRITTIDAFCRSLALQSPLSWGVLSGLGGRLETVTNPSALYRKAARRTLEALDSKDAAVREPVTALLDWRDNNWSEVEELIVKMLGQRNRWFQGFVFQRDGDWDELRKRLERPFLRAARERLQVLGGMLDALPGSRESVLELARFACGDPGKFSPHALAERAELPFAPFTEDGADEGLCLEDAAAAHSDLAQFLMTGEAWRKEGGLNVNHGFPATIEGRAAKRRFAEFVHALDEVPGLREALCAFQKPIPVRYTDEEWALVRSCFDVLRQAAGELHLVFAESGTVDFTEVAQIALRILAPENGLPSEFAIRQAGTIKHLLIDEFQDTSRGQHELLARLVAGWPEREGRSCFCVGDPMQSIYGFREAEVELFERVKTHGLEIGASLAASGFEAGPLVLDPVVLRANFRTVPSLVNDLNARMACIFDEDDGSGVKFSAVEAARDSASMAKTELHLAFTAASKGVIVSAPSGTKSTETAAAQMAEIVALVRGKLAAMKRSRMALGKDAGKYRIGVLARTKNSLVRIAEALRAAGIGFRAVELVTLRQRPEVLDALALARALLNPMDRTAWLAILRAPWCGLTLEELHMLTSTDDAAVCAMPVMGLLNDRLAELKDSGHIDSRANAAAARVARVMAEAMEARASAAGVALGSWLQSVWKALGGADTVTREAQGNLRLLWAALDKLPHGELDLLGPELDATLDALFALPDPDASSDFGVQLMTVHKSKGLEFEVVIVPDLQARSRQSEMEMMVWLERGLTGDEGDSDEALTEFLIAPIQAKGKDSGAAKTWVNAVRNQRAIAEQRRLLYVAATRAREELHLFARPQFRAEKKSGVLELCPAEGLLKTAWPGIKDEVETQFQAWIADHDKLKAEEITQGEELAIAAEMESDAGRPTKLKRLPEDYVAPEMTRWAVSVGGGASGTSASPNEGIENEDQQVLFARTEGGLESRLLGKTVHALLEQLSGAWANSAAALEEILPGLLPGIVATLRGQGLSRERARQIAAEALEAVRRTALDPVGAWILSPHAQAETESRWTGLVRGASGGESRWNLRPDRVFLASPHGSSKAEAGWWVIDYKTTDAGGANLSDPAARQEFLETHRGQHAAQLAVYAQVLRVLKTGDGGTVPVRAGIYYPRLLLFDWWDC